MTGPPPFGASGRSGWNISADIRPSILNPDSAAPVEAERGWPRAGAPEALRYTRISCGHSSDRCVRCGGWCLRPRSKGARSCCWRQRRSFPRRHSRGRPTHRSRRHPPSATPSGPTDPGSTTLVDQLVASLAATNADAVAAARARRNCPRALRRRDRLADAARDGGPRWSRRRSSSGCCSARWAGRREAERVLQAVIQRASAADEGGRRTRRPGRACARARAAGERSVPRRSRDGRRRFRAADGVGRPAQREAPARRRRARSYRAAIQADRGYAPGVRRPRPHDGRNEPACRDASSRSAR